MILILQNERNGMQVDGKAFDFCEAMWRLCDDVCERHAEFRHVDMGRVAVTFSQTRSPSLWGLQAKLTPLRFEHGSLFCVREGRRWTIQRVFHNGQEMLYLLTFYLPRFLNLSYEEKLVTVFHELYHISPEFNGDIRRFSESCYIHTGSQAAYDLRMAAFVRQYLRKQPPENLRRFLKYNFDRLNRCAGAIVGRRLITPRLIPVNDAA